MTASYAWCRYCNRSLSDPESCSRGYGPDCAVEYGLPHGGATGGRTSPGVGQQALNLDDPGDAT